MATHLYQFLHLNGTRVVEPVLGLGGTGVVYALKIPQLSQEIEGEPLVNEDEERSSRIRSIEDEKAIYRRLGNHPSIVRCYNLSSAEHTIRMDLMNDGDLLQYLTEQKPERSVKLSWFIQMARGIGFIHQKRIIADVRLENLLLNDGFTLKFADFGISSLMPGDWDLNGADELGFSIMTDIGQLGAVMYQIVTGQECKFDI